MCKWDSSQKTAIHPAPGPDHLKARSLFGGDLRQPKQSLIGSECRVSRLVGFMWRACNPMRLARRTLGARGIGFGCHSYGHARYQRKPVRGLKG